MTALIEPIPPNHSGNEPREVRELSVEAKSYEAGRAELFAQVPEGWRMVSIRRA